MTLVDPTLHPTLKSQIQRTGLSSCKKCSALLSFVKEVNQSYFEAAGNEATLEQSLNKESSQLHVIVQSLGDGLCVLDGQGSLLFMNRAAERLLGWTKDDLAGQDLLEKLQAGECHRSFAQFVQTGKPVRQDDGIFRAKNRRRLAVSYVINPVYSEGVSCGAVLVFRDISERKLLEEKLRYQAFHDPLTGLANRALFHDRLRHALTRAARRHEALGVMYVDLDNFKMVNDSLGHGAGDELLSIVADVLRSCVRQCDTVARMGGDEFAILLENITCPEDTKLVAGRILEKLLTSVTIKEKNVFIGASIGIAMSSLGGSSTDDLLRNADAAMYIAKNQGKGCIEFFDPEWHSAAKARLELESDLATAVGEGQFILHYQPTVSIKDGTIEGMEALLRWEHPRLGLIYPMDFIPLAEESGLIQPIGQWVLREACQQGKIWRDICPAHENLTMCVNLSARQLRSDDLVNDVANILLDTQFPPSSLVLEITESMMLEGGQPMVERLHALRALGVRLAIDDFGTGYSSLGYLQELPLDILKIDKSFVQNITQEGTCPVMDMIIGLANKLNLQTIVEGVDSESQIPILLGAGCDLAQGYYFSRPSDSDKMGQILSQPSKMRAA